MRKKFNKTKSIFCLGMTCAIVCSTTAIKVAPDSVIASTTNDKQEYIVEAVTNKTYNQIYLANSDKIVDISDESNKLEDENIIVLNLSKKEAENLSQKNGITVEPNYEITASNTNSEDDNFEVEDKKLTTALEDSLWNLDMMNVSDQYTEGKDNVRVAILDTGISPSSDLNVTEYVNLISGEENVEPLFQDLSGHGTSVANLINAKDNNRGITGINPNAELVSVKVLDDEEKGTVSRIVDGIYWCIDNNVDIINMSFGTPNITGILVMD